MTGLKLPFWGLSFGAGASFLVVRGGARAPGAPPWIRPCVTEVLIAKRLEHLRSGPPPGHRMKLLHVSEVSPVDLGSNLRGYCLVLHKRLK